MEFNDLLEREGISSKEVLVFRHSPKEADLRSVLPWLAVDKPKIFNAYQQMQGPRVEKAMQKAKFIASFIGHEAKKSRLHRVIQEASINNSVFQRGLEQECKCGTGNQVWHDRHDRQTRNCGLVRA